MNTPTPKFDKTKLLDNAVTSIRLGVEDFEQADAKGGDTARSLSSVRNLFAGVLLLFKFKIADCAINADEAESLIFTPPKIHPFPDGKGGVVWKPHGKFKRTTIDVITIKERLDAFQISVDWKVVEHLQSLRNDIEHLHANDAHGDLLVFVANLFPVLSDFINDHLGTTPNDLLGGAWFTMLNHVNMYKKLKADCEKQWAKAGLPGRMDAYIDQVRCEVCGYPLVKPNPEQIEEGLTVEGDESVFEYQCVSCDHRAKVKMALIYAMNIEFSADYKSPDIDIEDCIECGNSTFVASERECHWCGYELGDVRCLVCEEPLSQDEAAYGRLCSYHAHVADKERDR